MQDYRKTIELPDDDRYHYVELLDDQAGYRRHPFPTLDAAQLFATNHQQPGRGVLVDGQRA